MSGTLRGLLIEASRRSAACALAFALVLASPLAAAQSAAINIATIAAPTGVTDPDTSNNTATDSDTIVAPQLTLAKTATPSGFVIGVAGNYTLTLTNTGTTATTAVATITDTIATGLAIGTLPAGCTAAAQVVTCTVATGLAPGAANAVSFVIPVTPQTSIGTTSVANTATVRGGGDATCPASGAVDPRCNPSITTPVVASADVSVTKTDNSATYVPGLTAVYSIVVSNAGPSAASNVLVVDNMPASTTITGWTCAGAACPVASGTGSISQTIPTLASGASVTYTVTVATSAGATGPLNNTATVSSPTPDPAPGNNTATDTDTAVTTSDVAITKSLATSNPAQPGQTVTWTIVVTNNGPSDAVMTASDTVPSSVTGLTLGGADAASCTVAGQVVSCAFGSRSSGDSRTFTISGALSATATGTLSNTATVATTSTDTVPGNNSATSNTPIGTPANVSVVKTGPATVVTGTSYSYALTLGNSGQVATGTNLIVQDQLPAGVVATAISGAACGALPSTPGALLSCTVPGPITGGGSAVVTLTVTAPATAGAITNYAATSTSGTGSPGTPPGAACSSNATVSCSSAPTDVTPPPAQPFDFCAANTIWNVTGTGLGTPTATAQSPVYTIGGAETANPALDRLIPNGSFNGNMVDPVRNRLMFYNRSGSASQLWAYDPANGGWYVASNFTSADIPRAGMNQAGIGYLIGGGASPPVYRVTSTSQFGYTVAPAGSLTYNATPTDLSSGDIAFDAAGNGWIVVGQDLWKISAASLAANAPAAVRQQRPVLNGTPINFSLAGIAFGSDGKLYVANVGPTPASGYYAMDLNTSVLTRVANANAARDLASCAFPTLVPTVLGVTKTLAQVDGAPYVAGTPVRPGNTLTYAINVAYKSGELAATIFAGDVVDTLPANTTAVATGNDLTCSGSNCTNTAARTLQPGGNTTFNFLVSVNDPLPANTASISNVVVVKNIDCTATGNDCSEVTPIGPIVSVTKAAPATVLAGGSLVYTLDVSNVGATATPVGVVVQDQLPAGVIANSASGAACVPVPSGAGALLTCTLPSAIPANGNASFTITTTAPAVAGDITNHAATSTSGSGDPTTPPGAGCTSNSTTSCASATTTVQVPSLGLQKTAGIPVDVNGNGLVDAGDTIPYSFVVTNTGNVALSGVVVNDAKLSATPIACTPSTIAAGATANCGPLSYTITTADQTAGAVANSATATGTPTGGTPVSSDPSTTSTPVTPAVPALTLVKTAGTPVDVNGNGITDAGDTIAYSFVVTNGGNVPVNGVVIDDTKLSATPIVCTPVNVPVGGTANCGPVNYTITTADVTAGSVDNSATATGTPPGGTPTTSPPSTTTTPTTAPNASLTLVKTAGTPVDANGNGITDAGDTIAYSFAITNSGNVPLNGVVVNDSKLSATPIPCTPSTIAPAGTASCGPVTYTITPADETAGSVDNSATATGTPPGGTPVTSPPSTTSTPVTPAAPALTLVKSAGTPADANGNGITDAGDTIAYSFAITNAGNVPLNGVVVNDTKISPTPIACTPASMPVGGTASCGPVTYTITPADETAGSVDNSATATGTPPGGTPLTSPPSTTSTPITAPAASLTLVKTAGTPVDINGNGITDAGDTIAYSFVVTNGGNVPVNGVVINDAKISATPIVCTPSTIVPAGTANCGPVTYTITPADETAGSVDNSATATGTPPGGTPTTSPPSTTSTDVTPAAPALTLVKTAGTPVDVNGNGITDAGDTIAYSFAITNSGNVPLNGVVVNDAKISSTPIACTPADVSVAGTASCGPVTYTITVADETTGSVDNSATATGTPPGGSAVTSDPSTTSTPVVAATPALSLVKTAGTPVDVNGNGITDAGDTIAYSFVATNGGNVPLNGVVINDNMLSATPIACTPANVPVAGTTNCGPVVYTITAADEAAGSVDNSATATGTPSGGTPVTSDPATTSTPTNTPAPALGLVKTAGTPVDVNGNGITDAGDTIAYSFRATNAGNVPINGVVINDAKISATPIACTPTDIAANGGTADCGPVTYTITSADETAGSVDNSATATGTPPGGTPVTSPPSTTSTDVTPAAPALSLVKTAGTPVDTNGNGITDAGDTIAYSFAITNSGNVPLNGVVVNDTKLSATPIACTPADVAVGGTASCGPVTYTITVADETTGSVDNSATATGTPPGGTAVTSPPSTTSTPVTPAAAALGLVKTAGTPVDVNANGITDAGDTIAYSFVATNGGNVPLNGVVINDARISATPIACTPSTIAPAGTANCGPVIYTITPADETAGNVDNSATATGTPPGGAAVTSDPSTTTTPVVTAAPMLTLVKTAGTPVDVNGNGITDAGDTIAYTFAIINSGNVPLNGVVVNDAKLSATPIACTPANVPVAGTTNCGPMTYTIRASDVTAGSVDNSATASGTPTGGTVVTSSPSTTSTPVTAPAPSLRSQKQMSGYRDADGDGQVSVGDELTYAVTVTNTGNVALRDVAIADSRLTPNAITCASIAPNATCVLTGTYVVAQGDADAGQIVNTATVTTQPPPGGPVLPPEACPAGSTDARCAPSVTVPVTQRPAIATRKTATLTTDTRTQSVGNVGDVITYAVTATNTGNVTLFNVGVLDSLEGATPVALTCAPTTLAPGAVATCQGYTHTITAAEANAGGTLDNTVTASGSTNGGSQPVTVTATGGANVRVEADPTTIRVVKTASPRDVKVGDLVRYTVSIQNTGSANLVDGSLIDTPPPGFTYVDGSLAVADGDAAGRLAGTYPIRVDQIDIAGGDRATVTYLLRVGAGVRPGIHTNSAFVQEGGATVSNVATADVQMVADPVLDESLILGTVFDDRDGDGWQDSAAMTGIHAQGGFAPNAYVPHSTTVDRGNGPAPEADASAPMLHGIDLGELAGRQSDADPVAAHTVVISQTLASPDFSDDFVLTTKQGASVRMDAAGNTRVDRSGDAGKGLTGAVPTVERRVSQVAAGYRVDYVIGNAGVDERGIPGVRIASVEGLLVETDQFGRYHLLGVDGGSWERGRNFILKVDPAALPPGTVFTTDNPLVRRVTPGVPVRFDFGAKLPAGLVEGGEQAVEMELGTVMFDADSATLRDAYLPVVDRMAEQVRAHDGGEVLIAADGDSQALAYDRAKAVQAALLAKLPPQQAATLRVSLRTDVDDPASTLLTLGETPVLGTVLFDTDQATIKPEYAPVIEKIARDVATLVAHAKAPVVVDVVGHADSRGSDGHNTALGLRRAKAVFDAIAVQLDPEVRSQLRVDISDSPTAPVGIRGQ